MIMIASSSPSISPRTSALHPPSSPRPLSSARDARRRPPATLPGSSTVAHPSRAATTTTSTAGPAASRSSPPPPPSSSSTTTTTSSSSLRSTPSISRLLPLRSPKRPTRDAGTQYTPPDWPQTLAQAPPTHTSGPFAAPASAPSQVTTASAVSPATILADSSAGSPRQATGHVAPAVPPVVSTVRTSLSKSSATPSDALSDVAPSSPSKRQRQNKTPAKIMPRDFAKADTKELSIVIADMLMELIRVNDEIPLQDGQLTRFHSRAAPGISVKDYMTRLAYHAALPPPILLSMVTYIDRLCAAYPVFRINSLTVHRFLITAATVASKGLSDSFWTNGTYSKIGGVSIKELALLELELLSRVDWRIVPKLQELDDYYRNLVARCDGYEVEDPA